MSYTNSKAPSEKGIKATRAAVKVILEETVSLQMMFNALSAAASENNIPMDNGEFLECAEAVRGISRKMRRYQADLDQMSQDAYVESTIQRMITEARFSNTGCITAVVA